MFRFGYVDSALSLYNKYLIDFFDGSISHVPAEDSAEFEILKTTATMNRQKIAANLDYYGNPYNWVPKLDIVMNYTLYERNP